MQFRLNPVTLIAGAGSGIGAACAHDLARKSHGGLVLADMDETALALLADEIDAAGAAPERLSTMVMDGGDAARWAQATTFVQSQYGRLDWAVVNASAAQAKPVEQSDLVDWGSKTVAHLEGAIITLQALMTLIGKNTQGGAIVVIARAAAIKTEADARSAPGLLEVVRAAAQEGGANNVRINAIAPGGPETPMWAVVSGSREGGRQRARRIRQARVIAAARGALCTRRRCCAAHFAFAHRRNLCNRRHRGRGRQLHAVIGLAARFVRRRHVIHSAAFSGL
jgi:2-keto-3-deoxy-L-fuconate dehydrogenase